MNFDPPNPPGEPIDPVCLIHGKKWSEHVCIYCCLCWRSLKLEECNITNKNRREDVCKSCAEQERKSNGKQPQRNKKPQAPGQIGASNAR